MESDLIEMGISFTKLHKTTTTIDAPITFITSDLAIDLHAEKLTLINKRGKFVDCVLTVFASADDYQIIDKNAWFHLESTHRKANPTFNPDELYEIELKLSTVYLPMVLGQGVDIHQFITELVSASAKRQSHHLLNPKNWYALYVKQDVPLPPEFVSSVAQLKMGYSTAWTQQSHEPLFDLAQSYFLSKGFPFESVDRYQMLHVPTRTKAGQWLITVIALAERDEVVVYSIYPNAIPEAKQFDLMVFITRANFGLTQGSFELDLDSGELRCRTSLDFEIGAITTELFDSLVQNNIQLMEQYFAGIQNILNDQWDVMEALDCVESV